MVASIVFQVLGVIFGIVAIVAFALFVFSGGDCNELLCAFLAGLILCFVFVACAAIQEEKGTTTETIVVEAVVEDKQISSIKSASGLSTNIFHITINVEDEMKTFEISRSEYDNVREGENISVEKTVKTVFGDVEEPTYKLVLPELATD